MKIMAILPDIVFPSKEFFILPKMKRKTTQTPNRTLLLNLEIQVEQFLPRNGELFGTKNICQRTAIGNIKTPVMCILHK
jgi:hypothetical protein